MMRKTLLGATAMALSLPASAWAQMPSAPISGLYVGAGVGWNYLEGEQLKNFATQSAAFGGVSVNNKSVNFGSGFATVLSLGWGIGNGLRAELEGNYCYNSNNANGSAPSFTSVQGTRNGTELKAGAMVNVLYDFTEGFGPGYTPYV